uniref:Uncharacterized protein n=1 Tax=Mastacembelus armatus TaxID=205130 RepID=A0A3Q3ME43_9TELE
PCNSAGRCVCDLADRCISGACKLKAVGGLAAAPQRQFAACLWVTELIQGLDLSWREFTQTVYCS